MQWGSDAPACPEEIIQDPPLLQPRPTLSRPIRRLTHARGDLVTQVRGLFSGFPLNEQIIYYHNVSKRIIFSGTDTYFDLDSNVPMV